MSPASEILVIILAIFLAIFLLLGIILAVYLVKLTAEIRSITKSAKHAVDNIEHAVTNAAQVTSPLYIAKLIGRSIKKFKDK